MLKKFIKTKFILILGLVVFFAGCKHNSDVIYKKAFEVVYNSNGGSGSMDSDYALDVEKFKLKENGFKKFGYTFTGWLEAPYQEYDENGDAKYTLYQPGQEISVKGNVTFYAQWKDNITRTISPENSKTVPVKSIYEGEEGEIELYFQTIIDEEGNERVVSDIPFISMDDVPKFTQAFFVYGTEPKMNNYGSFYSLENNKEFINFYFDTNQVLITDIYTFNMSPYSMGGMDILSSSYRFTSGENFFFKRLEEWSYYVSPEYRVINLDNYDIHLLTDAEGKGYVPLQTFSDLTWSHYVSMYNGNEVYLMHNENLKDDFYENATEEQPSWDLIEYSFNETCLALDCYYGLKEEHSIKDFRSYISSLNMEDGSSMLESFLSEDPLKPTQALHNLIETYFDDLHSGFMLPNPYYPATSFKDRNTQAALNTTYGVSFISYLTLSDYLQEKRFNTFKSLSGEFEIVNREDKLPMYEDKEYEDGIVIILTFDGFEANTISSNYYSYPEVIRNKLLEDSVNTGKADIFCLIGYTQNRIKNYIEEGKKIKAVIIDDSYNGGGDADAAVFINAWIKSGKERFIVKDSITGQQSVCAYNIDTNFDCEFDSSDSLLGLSPDTKIYCLISGKSFSCGNYMPTSIKGSKNVTLIGQKTGGGACVVQKKTSALGEMYTISSPKKLQYIVNGSQYSVDTGVDPDVYVSDFENIYDREKLVELINNLK